MAVHWSATKTKKELYFWLFLEMLDIKLKTNKRKQIFNLTLMSG